MATSRFGVASGGDNPGADSSNPQNRPFRADLDEVTVFTKALTAAEVSELYAAP